jgi:hypothetical protein
MLKGKHNVYTAASSLLAKCQDEGLPQVSEKDRLRFWAKVDRNGTGGCWLWTAGRIGNGYGQFSVGGRRQRRPVYAHRFSWSVTRGPIPDGLFVCHACDVRLCVNPSHLFLGTHTDNMADARAKRRLSVPRPGRQKVTDRQLSEIAEQALRGVPQNVIAERYNLSPAYICLLLKGERRQYGSEAPHV